MTVSKFAHGTAVRASLLPGILEIKLDGVSLCRSLQLPYSLLFNWFSYKQTLLITFTMNVKQFVSRNFEFCFNVNHLCSQSIALQLLWIELGWYRLNSRKMWKNRLLKLKQDGNVKHFKTTGRLKTRDEQCMSDSEMQ